MDTGGVRANNQLANSISFHTNTKARHGTCKLYITCNKAMNVA